MRTAIKHNETIQVRSLTVDTENSETMSDSEESDIGDLFQQAEKDHSERVKQINQKLDAQDSDDDGSSDGSVVLLSNACRASSNTVSAKLQNLNRQRAVNERKRRAFQNSDDEDSDDMEIVQAPMVVKKKAVDNSLLDDSSDEEPMNGQRSTLPQDGLMNKQTAEALENLQKKAAALTSKENASNQSNNPGSYSALAIELEDDENILNITVHATIHGASSKDVTEQSTNFYFSEDNQTVQSLMNKILSTLQLDRDTHVIGLSHASQVLHARQHLSLFALPSVCDIQATIRSSAVSSTQQKKKASSTKEFGPRLRVTLRMGQSETKLTIGTNEPLQSLMEAYGQQKVKLLFDGDELLLDKTPRFYEMEDEDLIDVAPL